MSNVSLIDGHIDENTASTKAEILAHVKKVGNEIAKKEQAKKEKEKHEYDAAMERLENIHTVAKDIIEISNACLKAHIPFPHSCDRGLSTINGGKIAIKFSIKNSKAVFITSERIIRNNYPLYININSKEINLYNHGVPQPIYTLLIEEFCDCFDVFAKDFFDWVKNVEAD